MTDLEKITEVKALVIKAAGLSHQITPENLVVDLPEADRLEHATMCSDLLLHLKGRLCESAMWASTIESVAKDDSDD